MNKGSRIIWAVDPFEKPGTFQKNAVKTLRLLKNGLHLNIEPVYVLRTQLDDPLLLNAPMLDGQYQATLLQLKVLAERTPELSLLEPGLLRSTGSSLTSAVDALSEYAKTSDANIIVVNTHAQKGIKRLFVGSFTETLLLRSRIPVVSVNPHVKKPDALKHILFPTEFGRRSHVLFRRTVEIAQDFSAKVTLFHAIPNPTVPYTRENVIFPQKFRQLMEDYQARERLRTLRRARAWRDWALLQGVHVELIIETRSGTIWRHLINSAIRHKVHLITLESQSGPAVSNLIGSTTRQVVRNASCPVWILRSRYAEHNRVPAPLRIRRVG